MVGRYLFNLKIRVTDNNNRLDSSTYQYWLWHNVIALLSSVCYFVSSPGGVITKGDMGIDPSVFCIYFTTRYSYSTKLCSYFVEIFKINNTQKKKFDFQRYFIFIILQMFSKNDILLWFIFHSIFNRKSNIKNYFI